MFTLMVAYRNCQIKSLAEVLSELQCSTIKSSAHNSKDSEAHKSKESENLKERKDEAHHCNMSTSDDNHYD